MIESLKKINFLISKRQRKALIFLLVFLFIGMFLEIFGLGILIPVVSIILDQDEVENISAILYFRNLFSFISYRSFIFLFFLGVVLIYLIKSFFLIFLNFKQNRFLSNLSASISNKLFESYLKQPYSFHLNNNSSQLIKNLQVEVSNLNTYLLALITIFTESAMIISIITFLIFIEPIGALSVGTFFIFLSYLFFHFTKQRIKIWGDIRVQLDNISSKIILESLGGIKDIIILNKIFFFTQLFSNNNFYKARVSSNQHTVAQIPRIYLEFLSVLGLISFIISMLIQGKSSDYLIITLGVFVAAIFRVLPSFNKIISSFQSIKYYNSSLNTIHEQMLDCKTEDKINLSSSVHFQNHIKLENISLKFNSQNYILKDLNFTIKKGEVIGIIGESGSGKSTLIDIITGLNKPTEGVLKIDNIPNLQFSDTWKSMIGYVSQSIFLIDDSIKKNIALGIPEEKIDNKLINKLLDQVKLSKFISTLENGLDTRVGERGVQLSGGQIQRIGIARALYNKPQVLILDEATSALDSETEFDIMKSIDRLKGDITIVMIAHRISTLANADKVYEVKNKKISKI